MRESPTVVQTRQPDALQSPLFPRNLSSYGNLGQSASARSRAEPIWDSNERDVSVVHLNFYMNQVVQHTKLLTNTCNDGDGPS